MAAKYGHTEIATALIERGADVDAKDWYDKTPLHFATINGHTDTAIALIERGASFSRHNTLFYAIQYGQTQTSIALIERGAIFDESTMSWAIETGNKEVAMYLIENGANPASNNKRGQTAFHIATATNNYPIIRTLVEFDKKNNAASYLQKSFRSSLFHYKKRKSSSHEIGQNNKCIRI